MLKSIFVCTNCGSTTSKWYGRCPSCGEWNTLEENTVETGKKGTKSNSHPGSVLRFRFLTWRA